MSSPYVTLGNRPLDQWKVTELREELKRRKLTIKGLKEDLIKRLDEAVRNEWETAKESTDNDLNEVNQSELLSEQEAEDNIVSGRSKDLADTGGGPNRALDSSPETGIDHDRGLLSEGKVIEVNPTQEISTVEVVGEQVSLSTTVETAVVVSETNEPVNTLSGSVSHQYGQQHNDVDLTIGVNHGVESQHEDVTAELSDPNIQMSRIDESSMTTLLPGGLSINGSEFQSEATVSMDQFEIGNSECPQPDHMVQHSKYQVSEVEHPHLGSQVITDSVYTESVSIIEKNVLKLDVINDSVKLELDVDCEIPHPPSSFTPDGGETHPMDVEEPPLDTKVLNEEIHSLDAETVDSPKNIDGDELGPEKLSLDRSSGDDSMEEDVLESKQMEYKSISSETIDLVEKSELLIVEEDNIVDVVGTDKTVEAIVDNTESTKVSALTTAKRKFDDNEAVGNIDIAKRPHRWKVGGPKGSEQERGNSETLKIPKGSSQDSQTSIRRCNTSDSTNNDSPKERLVPPSSKLPSNSLRIDRFLRPFTLKAVQELLGKTGTVTSFWMDQIKTHCYVSYSSIEEAVETRNAVYNLQWPPNGGRILVAEFVDPQEVKVKTRVDAPSASAATPSSSAPSTFTTTQPPVQPEPSPRKQVPTLQLPPPSLPPPPLANSAPARERQHPSRVPLPREQQHLLPARDHPNLPPPPLPEKIDPPIVTLDDLFRKTISTPRIYYLPLSDEIVEAKLKSQRKNI